MASIRGIVFVAVVCVLSAARVASSCVVDADCDNGDTCSVPDTCVAGSCVLGGGGDTNGDLVCDDELDDTFLLRVTKLVFRRQTASVDNSSIKGRGDLLVQGSPIGSFIGEDGVGIRVRDNLIGVPPPGQGADVTFAWALDDCKSKPGAKNTRCRSIDNRGAILFKRSPLSPNQFRFTFKLKGGFGLAGPFFGPARLTISRGARHRSDLMIDCKLTRTGLQCREF